MKVCGALRHPPALPRKQNKQAVILEKIFKHILRISPGDGCSTGRVRSGVIQMSILHSEIPNLDPSVICEEATGTVNRQNSFLFLVFLFSGQLCLRN